MEIPITAADPNQGMVRTKPLTTFYMRIAWKTAENPNANPHSLMPWYECIRVESTGQYGVTQEQNFQMWEVDKDGGNRKTDIYIFATIKYSSNIPIGTAIGPLIYRDIRSDNEIPGVIHQISHLQGEEKKEHPTTLTTSSSPSHTTEEKGPPPANTGGKRKKRKYRKRKTRKSKKHKKRKKRKRKTKKKRRKHNKK